MLAKFGLTHRKREKRMDKIQAQRRLAWIGPLDFEWIKSVHITATVCDGIGRSESAPTVILLCAIIGVRILSRNNAQNDNHRQSAEARVACGAREASIQDLVNSDRIYF